MFGLLFCYFCEKTGRILAEVVISLGQQKEYDEVTEKKSSPKKDVVAITARERIQALRYLEKQKKNPELAKKLGIEIKVKERGEKHE